METIREKIARDETVAAGWKHFDVLMAAWRDEEAGMEARWKEIDARSREKAGNSSYTRGNFLRIAVRRSVEMAFHFAMTGDESSADFARRWTGRFCAEPHWVVQGTKSNWRAEDGTGAVSQVLGLLGSAGETGPWLQAVQEKGVKPLLSDWLDPATRVHALDSMGHNWWSVCVSGAAMGLFALRDEWEEAGDWLNRIADSLPEFFAFPGNVLQNKRPTFGPDGEFVESSGYLDYTLHSLLPVLDAFRMICGRDVAAELPVLEKIPDYYLALLQRIDGRIQRINFGNMGSGPDSVGGRSHAVMAIWLWLAGRFGRADLWEVVTRVLPQPTRFQEFLSWPDTATLTRRAPRRNEAIFSSIGVAVLRDDPGDHETVFAIKAGETWNHNHADAGSFILSSAGREFLIDPGMTDYSSSLNGTYFWTSHAHNVVLHNDRGQNMEQHYLGTKFVGRIAGSLFTPGYRYVLADATGPWADVYQRFYRHVLWIGRCLVVLDDLMTEQPGTLTQLLHYRGEAEVRGPVVKITNSGKTLAVHHVYPVPETFEKRTGYLSRSTSNPWKVEYTIDELPYLAVPYAARDRREKILRVFELPDGPDTQITAFSGENHNGVSISLPDRRWDILCNHLADGRKMHQNACLTWTDWATDGFLLAVETDRHSEVRSAAIHNASYLRHRGRTLYNALLKGDVRLFFGDDFVEVAGALSAPAWTDLAAPHKPWSARVRLPAGAATRRFPMNEGAA